MATSREPMTLGGYADVAKAAIDSLSAELDTAYTAYASQRRSPAAPIFLSPPPADTPSVLLYAAEELSDALIAGLNIKTFVVTEDVYKLLIEGHRTIPTVRVSFMPSSRRVHVQLLGRLVVWYNDLLEPINVTELTPDELAQFGGGRPGLSYRKERARELMEQ